jgi:hypothetical protein
VPVTVVDYGLTDDQFAWLAHQPVSVMPFPAGGFPRDGPDWPAYVKPLALGLAPYERAHWLDNDVLVEADLNPLFQAIARRPVVLRDYFVARDADLANAPALYDRYPIQRRGPAPRARPAAACPGGAIGALPARVYFGRPRGGAGGTAHRPRPTTAADQKYRFHLDFDLAAPKLAVDLLVRPVMRPHLPALDAGGRPLVGRRPPLESPTMWPPAPRARRDRSHGLGWPLGPERLEGRVVPAVITVMNTDDAGAGSLRDAITQADQDTTPDTITFAPGLTGTITLLSALPDLEHALTIERRFPRPGRNQPSDGCPG